MSERAEVIESKSTTSKKSLYEVSETPEEIVVSIDMPGVSKENVSLQATENRLYVDAKCKRGISMRMWGILGQE